MRIAQTANAISKMALTVNMAADKLESTDFEIVSRPVDGSRGISWCTVPTHIDADVPFDKREVLYCLKLSEVADVMETHPQSVGLVVLRRDEELPGVNPFPEELSERLLAVRETVDMGPSLVATAQSIVQVQILLYVQWRDSLVSVIERRGTIQDLIDESEQVLGDFIDVSDSTYSMVAHTKSFAPQDEFSRKLIASGHHDFESMQVAQKIGAFREWREQTDVKVFAPDDVVPCSYMTMVLRSGHAYAGHAVMVCNHNDLTAGLVDQFRVFATAVQAIVSRENIEAKPNAAFLMRLLGDHRLSSEFIGEQCDVLGIKSPGSFQVALVDINGGDYSEQPLWVSNVLADAIPGCVVCNYKENILAIATDEQNTLEPGSKNAEALNAFCNSMKCLAYVSDTFKDIRHVFYALQQTMLTRRFKPCIDIELRPLDDIDERMCFYFSEAFCFYCLDEDHDDGLHAFNIQHTQLDEMIEQNADRDVSDLKLLYFYLFNERKATPTAEQLHMHRNNVLYRVKNMEKKYGLNLDDFANRQRLLNCYRLKIMSSSKFRTMLV